MEENKAPVVYQPPQQQANPLMFLFILLALPLQAAMNLISGLVQLMQPPTLTGVGQRQYTNEETWTVERDEKGRIISITVHRNAIQK